MTNEKSTPAERVRAHFEAGAKRLKAAPAKVPIEKVTTSNKHEEPKKA